MGIGTATQRVSEMVREMVPKWHYRLTEQEAALGPHLRGNDALLEALSNLIMERILIRGKKDVPSDPVVCKESMARDREVLWILSKLDYVYNSPVSTDVDNSEQPG